MTLHSDERRTQCAALYGIDSGGQAGQVDAAIGSLSTKYLLPIECIDINGCRLRNTLDA